MKTVNNKNKENKMTVEQVEQFVFQLNTLEEELGIIFESIENIDLPLNNFRRVEAIQEEIQEAIKNLDNIDPQFSQVFRDIVLKIVRLFEVLEALDHHKQQALSQIDVLYEALTNSPSPQRLQSSTNQEVTI